MLLLDEPAAGVSAQEKYYSIEPLAAHRQGAEADPAHH